jgi:osmotically-inducible protein OsmY
MKVSLLAISAMIVFTACNREANRDSNASNATARTEDDSLTLSEKARSEGREMEKDVSGAANKTGEEARQAGRDIKEGTKEAGSKVKEEARQTGRDIKEGANAAGAKVGEEARQASRDAKGYMKADDAASTGDREILNRIRKALKSDAETAKEAGDISISVNQGKVSLFGTVTSTDTKAEMIRIAEKEKGVVRVTEEIKIAERVGAGSGD